MGHGCHDCGYPNMCLCEDKPVTENAAKDFWKDYFSKTTLVKACDTHSGPGVCTHNELEEISKLEGTGYLRWNGRGAYEAYKPAPISLELEDGDCTIKINGKPLGFCKRIELKAEADKDCRTVLEIERIAFLPHTNFVKEIESVKNHIGRLRLVLDYFPTTEDNKIYFEKGE